MGKIIFRLTMEGKTPSTLELPQKNVMGLKSGRKKFIAYYPGEDSCFVEDIFAKNKDLQPKKLPLFKYNVQSKETELIVDDSNVALVTYLTTHPWFGLNYNIFSQEKKAKEDLKQFEDVEKAFEYIKESDEDKLKAIAMSVFGLDSYYKTYTQCSADLKSKAIKEPRAIIESIESDDYETKYVAGLALVSGIVKINPTHTAIVWTDNDGVIIHIAQGENGLDKLSSFLRKQSEESLVLMQEFQNRLDNKLKSAKKENVFQSKLSEKDKEIERLKELLSNANKEEKVSSTPSVDSAPKSSLQIAQQKYFEKFNKEAPVAYKTNLEWLNKKLQD